MSDSVAHSPGSVTHWIMGIRQGDSLATESLAKRYFHQLRRISLSQLRQGRPIVDDDEDIAIQVLESVFRKMEKGSYPDLQDRNQLWFLMITITQRLVISRKRTRRNRKSPASLPDSETSEERELDFGDYGTTLPEVLETYNADLDQFLSNDDQTNQRASEILECWHELIRQIKDPLAKQIARLKLDGHSNQEIASILNIVPRSVERKFKLIEERWNTLFGRDF